MERGAGERYPQQWGIEQATAQYAQSIGLYLQNAGSEGVLRPQQRQVFGDIQTFFDEGNNRGFVNLPTGIGKTVLFVELSKALREHATLDGQATVRPPRILVASPTKDLVHQTMGRTGNKGYGRFAPGLRVGSYFSDSTTLERAELPNHDIAITTYRSLKIMEDTSTDTYMRRGMLDEETLRRLEGRKRFHWGTNLLGLFDVIILDEAHHANGDAVGSIIDRMPEDQVVLGFTATPDAGSDRRLISRLPYKIHELSLPEAIDMQLLAPVTPVSISSGVYVTDNEIYDGNGDFIDNELAYLAAIDRRNELAVEVARILKAAGVGMIVSCIAGNNAWHPHHIAKLFNKAGIKAAGVDSTLSTAERQRIYKQFETGGIDAITFIGLLGEGWDSRRAKGVINLRPTRSTIFATQRIGRVTRPGAPAYVIDIRDEHEIKAPPIIAADVLKQRSIAFGDTVGELDDPTQVQRILQQIAQQLPVELTMRAAYLLLEEEAQNLERLKNGVLYSERGVALYALLGAVNRAYMGITPEMISHYEDIASVTIKTKDAAQDGALRTVYELAGVKRMLTQIPFVEPSRWYESPDGTKWAPLRSICHLFEQRYPEVTREVVAKMLRALDKIPRWIPCKTPRPLTQHKKFNVEKAYRLTDESVRQLDTLLEEFYTTSGAVL